MNDDRPTPQIGPPRLCVVGCGDWAARMHLPAMWKLAREGQASYLAVCDLDQAQAARFAGALGVPGQAFTDAAAMLAEVDCDGVVILTDPPATPRLIALAADAGRPFLCEKPPAPDVQTHQALIERVGSLLHVVGYNRRFAPYLTTARQWLWGRSLQSVSCQFVRHRRHDPDFSTTAAHAIDTTLYLAGQSPAELRIETAQVGPAVNAFLTGWTRGNTRLEIAIMPDAASAQEHYAARAIDRAALVAFPQNGTVDHPGCVELHENNRRVDRRSGAEYLLAADDAPGLCGIVQEHELFARALRGLDVSPSTLSGTLAGRRVCDLYARLAGQGGRQSDTITF